MKCCIQHHLIERLQRCLIVPRTSLFAVSKGPLLNVEGSDFQDEEVLFIFGQWVS